MQILGLTASPVSKATLDATYAGMAQLRHNLDAQYVWVDEKDAELLVSPRPACRAGKHAACLGTHPHAGRSAMKWVCTAESGMHLMPGCCWPAAERRADCGGGGNLCGAGPEGC